MQIWAAGEESLKGAIGANCEELEEICSGKCRHADRFCVVNIHSVPEHSLLARGRILLRLSWRNKLLPFQEAPTNSELPVQSDGSDSHHCGSRISSSRPHLQPPFS